MNTLIGFICDYWYILISIAAVIALAGIVIYNFVKIPPSQQLEKIQEWLLYAVVEAEHELGSGTGQIKLRMVYDMFIGKFPSVAKVLTFDSFSALVDTALEKMEALLKTNKQLAKYVGREDEANVS